MSFLKVPNFEPNHSKKLLLITIFITVTEYLNKPVAARIWDSVYSELDVLLLWPCQLEDKVEHVENSCLPKGRGEIGGRGIQT